MKKLFAYAAAALVGVLVLATHSDAKPGGFGGGFKGKPFFAKAHAGKFKFAGHSHHHFAFKHLANHHHHGHHHNQLGFPLGWGLGWGAPYYSEPQIVEVPQESDDVTGSIEPRRLSVWRGSNSGGCSTESVTVPASQGGETTVRIVRC